MTCLVIKVEATELPRLGQAMAYAGLSGQFAVQPDGTATVTLEDDDAVRAILLFLERGIQLGFVEAARSDPHLPRPHPRLGH